MWGKFLSSPPSNKRKQQIFGRIEEAAIYIETLDRDMVG